SPIPGRPHPEKTAGADSRANTQMGRRSLRALWDVAKAEFRTCHRCTGRDMVGYRNSTLQWNTRTAEGLFDRKGSGRTPGGQEPRQSSRTEFQANPGLGRRTLPSDG